MSDDILFKIIVLGDTGVGKTALLHYYLNREFLEDSKITIGVNVLRKTITIKDGFYNVMFWDLGGQKRFRELQKLFVKGARGALLMFDLTNLFTLERIAEWLRVLKGVKEDIPIMLVGSKYDLIRDLEDENKIKEINEYALEIKEKYNFFDYIITSSKIGYNIDNTFKILLEKIGGQQESTRLSTLRMRSGLLASLL